MKNLEGFKSLIREKAKFLPQILFLFVFAMVSVAVLHPQIRENLRMKVLPDDREILSTVTGDIMGDGSVLKVVKVKSKLGLFLEVYKPNQDGFSTKMARIDLKDTKDGYFNFNGKTANLALKDINGDSIAEIIAPSFDEDFVAHLNVYSYNAFTGQFELISD